MKIEKTLLLGNGLIFGLLAGIGWLSHFHDVAKQNSNGQASASMSDPRRNLSPITGEDYGNAAYARMRMAQLKAISDPKERQRAAIELANSIPTDQIGKWLEGEWFSTSEGFDLSLFNRILMERLAKESPVECFMISSEKNLGYTPKMLDAAMTQPDLLLAYLSKGKSDYTRRVLIRLIAERDPKLALEAIKQSHKTGRKEYDESSTADTFRQIEHTSPGLIESQLDQLPLGLKQMALTGMFSEKMSKDLAGAISELAARSDGTQIFKSLTSDDELNKTLLENAASLPPVYRSLLIDRIIGHFSPDDSIKIAEFDYEKLGFSASQISHIHDSLIQDLSSNAPEAALKHLDWIGDDAEKRQMLLKDIVRSFLINSSDDRETAAQKLSGLIAEISDPGFKSLAESTLAENRNCRGEGDMDAQTQEAKPKQESLIPKMRSDIKSWVSEATTQIRDHHDTQDFLFVSEINSLPSAQQKEVAAAFIELPDEDKLPILKNILRYEVDDSAMGARLIAAEGLKSAIQNGTLGLDQQTGMLDPADAITYINKWARKDNAATTQWICTLPSGEMKTLIQKNIINNWAITDYEAAERWLKTLPAIEQQTLKPTLEKNRMK
jgi:hypothetical protein